MKIRARSRSFDDHFSQAILFWNSQTDEEKKHIIDAFSFELSKVETIGVRKQVVDMFANVSRELADKVAQNVGVEKAPSSIQPENVTTESRALSIYKNIKPGVEGKKVGLVATDKSAIRTLVQTFQLKGIIVEVISDKLGFIDGVEVKHTLESTYPVLFDSIYIASNFENPLAKRKLDIYMDETYNHYKTLGAEDALFIKPAYVEQEGIVVGINAFLEAFAIGRHFNRPLAIG